MNEIPEPLIRRVARITPIYAMTNPINYCKCGKPANKLVIYKGHEFVLCAKHIQKLEQFLGKKAEPLPRNYEPKEFTI